MKRDAMIKRVMKRIVVMSVEVCEGLFSRSCFVGLLLFACSAFGWAQTDIVTISTQTRSWWTTTTHYLSADGTSIEDLTDASKNSLWIRTLHDNGQYSFQHLSSGQYLAASSNNQLGLSAADETRFTVSGTASGTIQYRSGSGTTYSLRFNNSWSLSSSNSTTVTFTVYTKHVALSARFVDSNGKGQSFISWKEIDQSASQSVLLEVSLTEEDTYVSADGATIHGGGAATTRRFTDADFSITAANATLTGDNKVVLESVAWNSDREGWLFTFTPTSDDPVRRTAAEEVKDADGNYVQWLDICTVAFAYNGSTVTTSDFYLARGTFHIEVINKAQMDITPDPMRFAWQDWSAQTFEVYGVRLTGERIVRADGTVMTDPTEHIDLDMKWVTIHVFDELENKSIDWLHVTKESNTITVVPTTKNEGDKLRRARVILDYDNTETQTQTYLSIFFEQGHQYSGTEGVRLTHQKGLSGRDLVDGHAQSVHEVHTPIYFISGEELTLYLKERGFLSYVRWYDYEHHTDLGTHYVHAPEYDITVGGATDASDMYVLGEINGKDYSNTHGRYFSRTDGDYSAGSDIEEGKDQTRPIVKYDDEERHKIACDLSNYIDFSLDIVKGGMETGTGSVTKDVETFTEPTLSYRQIFELIPAKERAAELETCTAKIADHTQRYAAADEQYLEEHTIIVPTGQSVVLSPKFYYDQDSDEDDLRLADYGYIYKDGTSYHRIGKSGTEKAVWYKDGQTGDGTVRSGENVNVYELGAASLSTGQTEKEVVYTLETDKYNLCRFRLQYKPIAEIGPVTGGIAKFSAENIQKNYTVLETLDFNYETSIAEDFKVWNTPLPWDESTFGFRYADDEKRHPSRKLSNPFNVAYGEYALVNSIKHETSGWGGAWWTAMAQHSAGANGDASKGYMLYVDGTAEQGLVASLTTDANLCAGQQMYCSAWIGNPATNTSKTQPILLFVIEGKHTADKDWSAVSEYTTGKFARTAGSWAQVCFEIDLQHEYDAYRISIYNYAAATEGNDFVLDDICIFASQPPLLAYQAASLCTPGYVDAVIRIDYQTMSRGMMEEDRVYFDVFNETKATIVDMTYLNKNHRTDSLGKSVPYGYVVLPATTEQNPQPQYTSLAEFLNLEAETQSQANSGTAVTTEPKIGYIKETVNGEQRWVLFVRHLVPLSTETKDAEDKYQVRLAYRTNELDETKCAMHSYLPVSQGFDILIGGEIEKTPVEVCGKLRYDMKLIMNVVKMVGNQSIESHGVSKNDWILIENPIENMTLNDIKLLGKYTYEDIENALRHDLRQETSAYFGVTSLEEITDSTLMNDPKSYTLIRELVEAGCLFLGTDNLSPYVANGEKVVYLVMPIRNTGYEVDDKGELVSDENGNLIPIDQCFSPKLIELDAPKTDYTLEIGTSAMDNLPAAVKTQPTKVRCALATINAGEVGIPISKIQDIIVANDIEIIATTDPAFDLTRQSYRFAPDLAWEVGKPYYGDEGYEHIILKANGTLPTGKTQGTLREGYEYTFAIGLNKSVSQQAEDEKCTVAEAYFTLCIVPSYVEWSPQTSGPSNWNDDANWIIVDADGNPQTDAQGNVRRGSVPQGHTNVIIRYQADDSRYPVLVDSATYIAARHGLNAYDVNYQPARCKNIYLEAGAKLLNQEYLQYENAYVDAAFLAGNWYIFSPALDGVYTGDIYTPNDAATNDADPFAPGTFNGNRNYDYAYYHSFFNQATKQVWTDETRTDELYSASWSKYVNNLEIAYEHGKGYGILGYGPSDTDGELLTVRLPKSDTEYSYFDSQGNATSRKVSITRPAQSKFSYTLDASGEMTITLQNEKSNTDLFVFGNPTMAYVDMYKFLDANKEVLAQEFYRMDRGSWVVSDKLVASATEDYYLPPMRGVMVKTSTTQASVTLTLTSAMLTLDPNKAGRPLRKPHRMVGSTALATSLLTITAVNGNLESTVHIGESNTAVDGVVTGEDKYAVVSGLDGGNAMLTTPMTLHTQNESAALSVDIRQRLTSVPLTFSLIDRPSLADETILWFSGIDQFDVPVYLVDTLTGERTQLLNGLSVVIETPQHGEERYYIQVRSEKPDITTDDNDARGNDGCVDVEVLHVYYEQLPTHEVMVSANMEITEVVVYDLLGKRVFHTRPAQNTACFSLPQGAYMIETQTVGGRDIGKVIVR